MTHYTRQPVHGRSASRTSPDCRRGLDAAIVCSQPQSPCATRRSRQAMAYGATTVCGNRTATLHRCRRIIGGHKGRRTACTVKRGPRQGSNCSTRRAHSRWWQVTCRALQQATTRVRHVGDHGGGGAHAGRQRGGGSRHGQRQRKCHMGVYLATCQDWFENK
jgi:hypothetical protein